MEKVADVSEWTQLDTAADALEAARKISGAEIVFLWMKTQSWLQDCWGNADSLKWVQSHSSGLDSLLFPAFVESSVVLTNGRGHFAPPLAEFVMTSALFFAKNLRMLEENRLQRRWQRYHPEELRGQTMGIVGLGGTGLATARLAKAFGMRVLAVKRNIRPGLVIDCVDELVAADRWRDLLPASDYVVNALPLTAETRGMFGVAEFRAMKNTACFINVGRGPTVRETVLVRALREGWIASAGLDVFEVEPLPAESELYALPNVIVSPHSADQTVSSLDVSAVMLRENVRRYLSGEPLENLVDKRRGY
jgi:phosphoglycerate dehydrogenase-like enzyme